MIFVCTGTQVYQFDRLIAKIDELIENGIITDTVFAQIGASTYIPKHYEYRAFLDADRYAEYLDKADLVISHGGTGALISASKKGKNIIAVPRLAKYGEHVDDHQLQVVEILEQEGYIYAVYELDDLSAKLRQAMSTPISKPYQRVSAILELVDRFIEGL